MIIAVIANMNVKVKVSLRKMCYPCGEIHPCKPSFQRFGIVHSYTTFVVSFVVVDQGFVLAVTMVREAVDEVRRCRRDKEMNSQLYSKLTVRGDHDDDGSSDTRHKFSWMCLS